MSAGNPTHIIAEAVHAGVGGLAGRHYFDELAEHVVSKLTDFGYSIAPTSGKHLEIEPDTEMRGVVCRECGWHLAGTHVDVDTQKRNHDEHVAAAEGEKG